MTSPKAAVQKENEKEKHGEIVKRRGVKEDKRQFMYLISEKIASAFCESAFCDLPKEHRNYIQL